MAARVDTRPHRPFDRDLDALRAARRRTLALIEPLSQQQLDRVPAHGKWSVGEIADHLVLSEGVHRRFMEKLVRLKLEGKRPFLRVSQAELDVTLAFMPRSLAPLLDLPFSILSSIIVQPVREFVTRYRLLPFRAAREAQPRRGRSSASLREKLRTSMESTAAIFEGNAGLDFRELVCQHPLLGAMNMLELLRFLASHEARHHSQITETLRRR
jgi:uncharacterized damage-inducible protein DinB